MELNDVRTIVANLDDFLELPDGIERLRKTVLTLAVSGRLAPQVSREGTADELFKKIQKGRLKQASNVRRKSKTRELQPIATDEIPFKIPKSWKWVRLGEVYELNPRNTVPDDMLVSFLPMNRIATAWSDAPIATENRSWGEVKKGFTHISEGDVVLAKITPCFENGKSGVARRLTNGYAAGTTELHVFRDQTKLLVPEYLLCLLKSDSFLKSGESRMTGSAGQKRVPADYVFTHLFALPPIAEQERIVVMVSDVMKQLDELEAKKKERDAVRARLTRSAMRTLGEGEDKLALEHLTELIRTPADLKELEMAVLTLAVSGKLVPQNKDEEEVTEREVVKTRKSKVLSPVATEEIPFDIPESWGWSRFGSVFSDYGSGSTPSRGNDEYFKGNVNWYKSGELNDGILTDDAEEKVSDVALKKCHLRMNVAGDLLIAMYGATAGKVAILENEGVTNQAVWGGTPSPYVDVRYLFLYLLQSRSALIAKGAGAAQPNISGEKILSHVLPLPPLAEQKRIVQRVDQVRVLLNELKELL